MTRSADQMEEFLRCYERHLAVERGCSPHTTRAYLGDVRALMEFVGTIDGNRATPPDRPAVELLDLAVLRSWLAAMTVDGAARTSVARRAASARRFTAWLFRTGRTPDDPGLRLRSPKARRSLPGVLRQEQASELMAVAARRTEEPAGSATSLDPAAAAVALRDRALIEVLYATGVRVSELVGTDVEDIDHERRTLRVMGKGSKERVSFPSGSRRTMPYRPGLPEAALFWRGLGPDPRCSSGSGAVGWGFVRFVRSCTIWSITWTELPPSARTGCGIRRRPIFSTAARICGPSRRFSDTPRSRRRRSTPMCRSSGCAPVTARRIPGLDRRPVRDRRIGRSGVLAPLEYGTATCSVPKSDSDATLT